MANADCATDRMWTFRFRCRLSGGATLSIEEESVVLYTDANGIKIVLGSGKKGISITKAKDLVLSGTGFATEQEAREAGEHYEQALLRALFEARIGADFGDRSPSGSLSEAGKAHSEKTSGRRILHDDHGLMIYQTDPSPAFIRFEAAGARGAKPGRFLDTFRQSVEEGQPISDKRRLAFEFFSGSFFVKNADARFLMLFMALEALMEQQNRSPATLKAIADVRQSCKTDESIPDHEKESIIGGLAWLGQESLKQAGERLVTNLGAVEIGKKPALEFFRECMKIRHALVHGKTPAPTFSKVSSAAASLEVLVSRVFAATEPRSEKTQTRAVEE